MSETLLVRLHDTIVGDLVKADDGHLSFGYRPDATSALSISMPLREAPYDETALLPFFEGLLPEGIARERIAAKLRVDPAGVFALLGEIGRECAGAVSIAPEGWTPAPPEGRVRWLDGTALEAALAALPDSPLALDPAGGVRICFARASRCTRRAPCLSGRGPQRDVFDAAGAGIETEFRQHRGSRHRRPSGIARRTIRSHA